MKHATQRKTRGQFMTEYVLIVCVTLLPLLGMQLCSVPGSNQNLIRDVQDGIDAREHAHKSWIETPFVDPGLPSTRR